MGLSLKIPLKPVSLVAHTCSKPCLPVFVVKVLFDQFPEDVSTSRECEAVKQNGYSEHGQLSVTGLQQRPHTENISHINCKYLILNCTIDTGTDSDSR